MPIYAYRCEACGHAQDVLQKLSDPLLSVCPACGEACYRKQLTAAGFQLKGSGWYVTDFRNGSTGAKPASDDAGKADASKGDAAAAEAPKADAGKSDAPKAGSAKPDAAKPAASGSASPATAPAAAPVPAPRNAAPPAGP